MDAPIGPKVIRRSDDENNRWIVMEYPPMPATVSVKQFDEVFQLWTPWLVSFLRIPSLSMRLLARPRPLAHDDNELFDFGWPHVGSGGSVCYNPKPYIDDYIRFDDHTTTAQIEEMLAIGCMQIFLNGDSSYWICGDESIPFELRPNKVADVPDGFWEHFLGWGGRSKAQVIDFFRAWEKLSREEVLALSYRPVGNIYQLLAWELKRSPEELAQEERHYQHLFWEMSQ